ncbi:hypothetical protein POM88_010891 [Heracleum sosnowskyi]|uniref:Uncharacterized protein n=1 Tax=Heracleum sosnowskyi TaxID=360622 RepID=A0AAD8IU16_9APIA|nr:hypothetical protein POM88_010891 [Heracleum sosnowskyi]
MKEERHQYTSPLVEVVVSSLYKVREDASEWEVGGWKQELVNCGEYLGVHFAPFSIWKRVQLDYLWLVCVTEHMITFPTVFKIVHVGENENCVGTQESTCGKMMFSSIEYNRLCLYGHGTVFELLLHAPFLLLGLLYKEITSWSVAINQEPNKFMIVNRNSVKLSIILHCGTVILEWTTTSGRIGVRTAKEPCLTAPSSTKAYNWTSENVPDKKSAQWMWS